MNFIRISFRNVIKRRNSSMCSIFDFCPVVISKTRNIQNGIVKHGKTNILKNDIRFISHNKYFFASQQQGQEEDEKSELAYHQIADETLESLLEKLESYIEDIKEDSDIRLEQGVLTLQLGSKGTYVINKQTPNKQIWLSSPISGPFRYTYIDGNWKYHRDNHVLNDKLSKELEFLFNKKIKL